MSAYEKATNIRWRIFFVLFLLVVVSMIDRASISIAMPTIAKDLGLSDTMQGLILSGFFWTYACMQIPGGFLADKFGARIILACSAILWGTAEALLGLCPTGFALLAANLLLGASEAPVFPSGARLNAIWLNKNERARGATLMDAGGPFGAAIGGILVAEMMLYFTSWRITFIICGIAAITLGLIAYWVIRDRPEDSPRVNNKELGIINLDRVVQDTVEENNDPLLKVIPLRSFIGMLLGRCSWAMCFFGLLTWGPGYLTRALNLDLKAVGFATMIVFCAGGCGSLCGGWLADKLASKGFGQARSCKFLLTVSGICTLISFALLPSIQRKNIDYFTVLRCICFNVGKYVLDIPSFTGTPFSRSYRRRNDEYGGKCWGHLHSFISRTYFRCNKFIQSCTLFLCWLRSDIYFNDKHY